MSANLALQGTGNEIPLFEPGAADPAPGVQEAEAPRIASAPLEERMRPAARLPSAYRRLFQTPEGEAVLTDLCQFAGLDQDVALDGAQAQRFLGGRRLLLRILSMAETSEAEMIQRLRRQASRTFAEGDL